MQNIDYIPNKIIRTTLIKLTNLLNRLMSATNIKIDTINEATIIMPSSKLSQLKKLVLKINVERLIFFWDF